MPTDELTDAQLQEWLQDDGHGPYRTGQVKRLVREVQKLRRTIRSERHATEVTLAAAAGLDNAPKVVHILRNGAVLCFFDDAPTPNLWPPGHVWVRLEDAEKATCWRCIEFAKRLTSPGAASR